MEKEILDKYNLWLENSLYKKELEAMTEEELYDSFYKDLEFGTGGMRGLLGPGTNRLNIHIIKSVTNAYARYIISKYQGTRKVVIAYDNRRFSKDFAYASASVLSSFGITVYIFDSIHPTPLLSFAIRNLAAQGGIVITASHNPKEYNGYKVYNHNGAQLLPSESDELLKLYQENTDIFAIKLQENKDLIHLIGSRIDDDYLSYIFKLKTDDKKVISIVYTPLHGTGYSLNKKMLEYMGYTHYIVESQAYPSASFENTSSANPETDAAYEQALILAKEKNAELIVATDPDADRIGIIVKTDSGYHRLTGNETGALLINYLLTRKISKTRAANSILFDTIVTSPLGKAIAAKYGVETVSTLTGFKFIAEQIDLYKEKKNFIFGYEESYGYLILPIVRDKDSIQGFTYIAEMVNYYALQNKTLIDVLNEIYEQYGYYLAKQVSVDLPGSTGIEKTKELMAYFRRNSLRNIGGIAIDQFEDYLKLVSIDQQGNKKDLNIYKSDVIRYILVDKSIVAIRPSGTEPKIKFYYNVTAKTIEEAKTKLDNIKDFFTKAIQKYL